VAYSNIGGLSIVIGNNLSGDLKVTVGGTPAKILGKYGTNRLIVLLPAKPTGTYPLVVSNANGASESNSRTTVKYIPLFRGWGR
jgi:hypothetical protein